MNNIEKELFKYKEASNADFQSKLIPGIARKTFLGVRVPNIRKVAKSFENKPERIKFMHSLPHKYYDENMLHAIFICQIKDYDECIEEIERFIPYIDNWSACDVLSPKVLGKHTDLLIKKIKLWAKSKNTYECRLGIELLMNFYLDDNYKKEYLNIPSKIRSKEYYVNMMIAWFYATALAKKWDDTIVYLQENKLDVWTHNKTIQKAIESFRISDKQKEYLRTLRRNKNGIQE